MVVQVGIDPGPTYTGFVIIKDDVIVHSSTYKRKDQDIPIFYWANYVATEILEVLSTFDGEEIIVGVEGVTPPNAYHNGKKNLLPPKYLVNVSLMAGVIAGRVFEFAPVVVRPGKNGSGKDYPEELSGTRPKNLPGLKAGTRDHEKSAYDIANQAPLLKREGYVYDYQPPLV